MCVDSKCSVVQSLVRSAAAHVAVALTTRPKAETLLTSLYGVVHEEDTCPAPPPLSLVISPELILSSHSNL